jgi:hypothetical protein
VGSLDRLAELRDAARGPCGSDPYARIVDVTRSDRCVVRDVVGLQRNGLGPTGLERHVVSSAASIIRRLLAGRPASLIAHAFKHGPLRTRRQGVTKIVRPARILSTSADGGRTAQWGLRGRSVLRIAPTSHPVARVGGRT